ncbi:hypothetical protein BANRA_00015 [Escherichia coli]|uniref:Uncharacterized protein n=1 Tax=Escherichia coli TaxID=562 RepID=A0A3P5DJ71_ECOLX|nr:hypothetical protein BANRA_00015 [Escherichia coli]
MTKDMFTNHIKINILENSAIFMFFLSFRLLVKLTEIVINCHNVEVKINIR